MRKRILSLLLCCVMLIGLLPTAAFAEDSAEEPPVCICETTCTADNMNKECPACGAENAIPQNCGQYIPVEDRTGENGSTERADDPNGLTELSAADQVQAMINALPSAEAITEENAEEVEAQLDAIDEAKENLTDEEIDKLDLSRYNEVSTVLGDMAGLMSLSAFAADAIDYGFTINGTDVTSENIGKLPGVTGTVSYDQDAKTLTLDGVTITSSNRKAIECRDGVAAIKLVGANEILFTAEAAVATKGTRIYGIYQGKRDKVLTISGSSRSDSLKITVPKITEHTLDQEYPANCIYVLKNLEIRSCTLDILNPEILWGGSYSPLLYSENGDITLKDCDLKAVLGKDRSGEINKVPIGRIVCATQGDITITDSKVEAGVFSSSEGGTFAAIDGNNITVTGSELDLKVKVASNGDYSVRALHIEHPSGKINLTDCFGTIEVGSSNQCKCFGLDIWPGAKNECLTIDGCTLTINILGTNMTSEKEQAILIQGDSDTATNKWPIFKNISEFTYGDTADSAVTKAPGNTETGFWRKHYLKITAAPTALTLDQTALELATGSSGTLTAAVSPAHAEQNVTWTSSNESVATVVNGVVTAVSAGTATITASTSGLSASCNVTVKDPIYSVTLHTGDGTIADGKNVTNYTYGEGAALPTADDMTYTGHTFKGWYDNEGLAGDPVTEISDSETGDKEYWAKWEINQYTVTVKPENGEADIAITQDYGTPITAPTLAREGYQFNGWDKAFPTTMPAEDLTVTAQWIDIAAPTGEIKIAENGWKSFLNTITFGLFFKDTQMVTVTAADNSGEAVKIEYLLSDEELAQAELAGMTLTAYSAPFSINPDNEYVIYAKLTDTSGNVAYINTNGIVLDATVPVISGIENGKTYCAAQIVTVDEKYIDTVKVNGNTVTLDRNNQFTLNPAEGEQTIVVTDKAGNETRVIVTVNDGHTYEWQSENGQYWQKCKFCDHETAKKDIPTINISGADKVCRTQDYKFSFALPEGATDAAYGYEFIGLGDGPLTPTVADNLYSGIIKVSAYPAEETSFKLIVSAKTADGFEFSAEKTVAIQNEHAGGTATCKDKAICEVCGESYGELNANNHTDLKHIEAKAATKTAEGNTEYWYCEDCNKYFADKNGNKEITKADTVTAKLPEEKPTSPKTGDTSNLALWIALLFVSGGAAISTTVVSRKKKRSVK